MKTKMNHIMTSGEILSKKKNKIIVILSIILAISVIFNIYLFTDISVSGLDELIPAKSAVQEKEENEIADKKSSKSTPYSFPDNNENKNETVLKVTEADIDKLDRSSIEAFERESGIELIYNEKPLGLKLYMEPDDAEGGLYFSDTNNPCKEFVFSSKECYAHFTDGSSCTFNYEKVNEIKDILTKYQIYYYSQPHYETEGGKVVNVKIESFGISVRSSKGEVYGEFFLPYNYDELKDYFETLHQICVSE